MRDCPHCRVGKALLVSVASGKTVKVHLQDTRACCPGPLSSAEVTPGFHWCYHHFLKVTRGWERSLV